MYNKIEQRIRVFLWGTEIGTLSWNGAKDNSFFFFSQNYFREQYDIAPLTFPKNDPSSHLAILGLNGNHGEPELGIYQSLPPFIADSLPDGWGNMVFERWFESHGLKESDKTPLTKLTFIGQRAIGALEFKPCYDLPSVQRVDLNELYNEALIYEQSLRKKTISASEDISIETFAGMGTSAGGRQMKAIVSVDSEGNFYSGQVDGRPDTKSCILKFNTPRYSLCEIEKTYYDLALLCGIKMMPSRLVYGGGTCHFLTERFDRKDGNKIFTQTLAAMAPGARTYEDLFSTCTRLGLGYDEKEELFCRTVFNYLLNNTDDHSKNFSFLMECNGVWHLSPAYDMNFIIANNGITPQTRHCMSILGKYYDVSRDDLLEFARLQGIKNPNRIINKVIDSAKSFPELAKKNGIGDFFADMITRRLSNLCEIEISAHNEPLIVVSAKGNTASDIIFLLNDKEDRIVVQARVNGVEKKIIFSKNAPRFKEILDGGLNNMPENLKRRIVNECFLEKADISQNEKNGICPFYLEENNIPSDFHKQIDLIGRYESPIRIGDVYGSVQKVSDELKFQDMYSIKRCIGDAFTANGKDYTVTEDIERCKDILSLGGGIWATDPDGNRAYLAFSIEKQGLIVTKPYEQAQREAAGERRRKASEEKTQPTEKKQSHSKTQKKPPKINLTYSPG